MKYIKAFLKVFSLTLVIILTSGLILNVSAFADAEDLPHVSRWLNGAAVASDSSFLRDTWAVDDTNISEKKYVLLDQDGIETMRVAKYPSDISNGNVTPVQTYYADLKLTLPDKVSGEVILTFKNDIATYFIYFNEKNSYKTSTEFIPGEYEVSEIDVVLDSENEYKLTDSYTLKISNKNVSETLEIADESTVGKNSNKNKGNKNDILEGKEDLLSDTVWLLIGVAALFIVYAFIKFRRRKEEEI